mgnify:CR=1 FL=1
MVREAVKKDLKDILKLYLHLHETSVPQQSGRLSDAWAQILKDENHHLSVNEVGGKIVSTCVCVVIPNLTRDARPYALVENVVTHRDFQSQGLASECLEYAKQIAKQCDCYKMMLLTGSKEERIFHFYRNAGYNSVYSMAG